MEEESVVTSSTVGMTTVTKSASKFSFIFKMHKRFYKKIKTSLNFVQFSQPVRLSVLHLFGMLALLL